MVNIKFYQLYERLVGGGDSQGGAQTSQKYDILPLYLLLFIFASNSIQVYIESVYSFVRTFDILNKMTGVTK